MKQNIFLFFLLCIVFISSAYAVELDFGGDITKPSWQSEVEFECSGVICVEGGLVGFNMGLQNVGDEEFTVEEIYLVDDGKVIFADFRDVNKKIIPDESKQFQFTANIPPPTRGSTVSYKVCYVIGGEAECELIPRSMIVLPLSEVECDSNKACQYDEYCKNYKCFKKPKPMLGVTEYLLVGCLILLFIIIFLLIKNKK